jgi:hypothetical protein
MPRPSIYVVEVDDGNRISVVTRYVLIADTATAAEGIVARRHWPEHDWDRGPSQDPTPPDLSARMEVGRLGAYDPGSTGAALAQRWPLLAVDKVGAR